MKLFSFQNPRRLFSILSLLLLAIRASATPGDLDSTFNVASSNSVNALAIHPDGRVIGMGSSLFKADRQGYEDWYFHQQAIFSPSAKCVSVLSNDRILVAGGFRLLSGTSFSRNLAVLDKNGVVIQSFDVVANGEITCMDVQKDGRILIGGAFTTIGGVAQKGIARLLPSGERDVSFTSPVLNGQCNVISAQSDGRILIGGGFTTVAGVARAKVARLSGGGSLDASFIANVTGDVSWLLEQKDSKVLIGGNFTQINTTAAHSVARVGNNGAFDATFTMPANPSHATVAGALQTDGKILVAGNFSQDGVARSTVFRLRENGTLDESFQAGFVGSVASLSLSGDGTVFAAGYLTHPARISGNGMVGLLNDPGVSEIQLLPDRVRWSRSGSAPEVRSVGLEVLGEDHLWVSLGELQRVGGGWETANAGLPAKGVLRATARALQSGHGSLLADTLNYGGAAPHLVFENQSGIAFPSDSGLLQFGTVLPGHSRSIDITLRNTGDGILKDLSATLAGDNASSFLIRGTLPSSLAPDESTTLTVIFNASELQTLSAALTISSSGNAKPSYSFNLAGTGSQSISPVFNRADEVPVTKAVPVTTGLTFGTLTLGFAPLPGTVLTVIRGNGTASGMFSDLLQGSYLDASFNGITYRFLVGYRGGAGTDLTLTLAGDGTLLENMVSPFIGSLVKLARDADGRLLVNSYFTDISSYRLHRFKKTGGIDPSFNCTAKTSITDIVIQNDGKIVVSGEIYPAGGSLLRVARFHPDGSIDTGFGATIDGAVADICLQPDGKIILGGGFSTVNSVFQPGLVRLNSDGSIDATFNAGLNSSGYVRTVSLQPDGRIVAGGRGFESTGSPNTTGDIARFSVDGIRDASFAFSTGTEMLSCVQQPDGKFLVMRQLFNVTDVVLDRLNSDGTHDAGFNVSGSYYSDKLALLGDGRILVGGVSVNGIVGVVRRLFPDGTPDPAFRCDVRNGVTGILADDHGVAYVSGYLTSVSGVTVGPLVKIGNGAGSSEMEFVDATTVRWNRSGTAPEIRQVIFESIQPGDAAWSPLGAGVLLPDGWRFSSGTIPENATVRARGEFVGSAGNTGVASGSVSRGSALPDLMVNKEGVTISSPEGVLDLGSKTLGFSKDSLIEIKNQGAGVLSGISCSIIGGAPGEFEIVSPPNDRLDPLAADSLLIRFRPAAVGLATANLRIESNDPSEIHHTFALSGSGVTELAPAFSNASEVPFTAESFTATGKTFGNLTLNYAPFNGTVLTAIQNTGTDPINGAFADLADRATVSAVFNGRTYVFIASYHGGSGNDLTLSLSGPGVLDPSFHAGADGEVSTIGIQADGKILIGGGTFLNVGEVPSQRIARLWPDGSIDADFKASSDGEIESFVIQDNGRIIIAGAFSQVNGFARKGIARLNSDGSLDMDFDLRLEGPVNCMSLLRGGKILVGGGTASTAPLGMGRRGLARLNADGTLDSTFSCDVNGSVTATTELADGSIMIGGQFSTVAGTARTNLAKITATGLLDSSFIADIRSGFIYCLAQQTDGKILVGGFALYTSSSSSQYGLIRLSSTGYFDPVYSQPSVGLALSLLVQLNDKVIVCGSIYDPVKKINRQVARINAQGIQETNFAASCNGYAYSAAMTPDGSILIGGGFRRMGEFSIGGIAKLKNVPVNQKLEIVGGNTLSWTRTGATTEFIEVDFQVSPGDGSDWTTLGVGTKISTGWQLVTDSLPSSGYVRARGREYSSNQAFATIEMTALFGRDLRRIEQWRQQHFGAPTNERSAADLADADGDGVKNLLEYAFGLPPRTSGSGAIPEWSNATEKFEIEFVQPPDVSGIIYGAEWSGSLEADDWHEVSDLGGGVQHRFVVPREGQPRRFVRLKVTHP